MKDKRYGWKAKFKKLNECPMCGSNNIFFFEHENFCLGCDWNSIRENVWAGHYDPPNPMREYNDLRKQLSGDKSWNQSTMMKAMM